MDKLKLVLETQLEDDDSELGGVSHYGETLNDFLLDCDIKIPDNYTDGWMKKINDILIENGIRPLSKA